MSAEEVVAGEIAAENAAAEEAAMLTLHAAPAAAPAAGAARPAPPDAPYAYADASSAPAPEPEKNRASEDAPEKPVPAPAATAAEAALAATVADEAHDLERALGETRRTDRRRRAAARARKRRLGDAVAPPEPLAPKYALVDLGSRPDLASTRPPPRPRGPRPAPAPEPRTPRTPEGPGRSGRAVSDPVFCEPLEFCKGKLDRFDDLELPNIVDPTLCAVTFDNIHEITTRRRAIGMARKKAQKQRGTIRKGSKLSQNIADARAEDAAHAATFRKLKER